MSYILDALVKADQERQRQRVPGLRTVPARAKAGRASRLPWPLAAAGGGIAAAGLMLAAHHWWPAPAGRPVAALASGSVPAVPAPEGPSLLPAPMPVRPAQALPEGDEAAAPAARKARPERRLYEIDELPADLRQEARRLNVAGFAQADDAGGRLAIINDRAVREGDEVTEGLRVERISKQGVVFNYKGYRFRKGGA